MTKKCVVFYIDEKPIKAMDIVEFENAHDYIALKNTCEANLKELVNYIKDLETRLKSCENELAYNRGDSESL